MTGIFVVLTLLVKMVVTILSYVVQVHLLQATIRGIQHPSVVDGYSALRSVLVAAIMLTGVVV